MSIFSRLFGTSRGAVPSVDAEAAPAGRKAELLGKIQAAGAANRHADALALATDALAETPDDPDFAFERGSALFAWGRLREAREAFDAMLTRGLDHERLFLNLGWSYLETGDIEGAGRWMQEAAAAHPAMDPVHYGLAMVLLRQNRPDDAVVACGRALTLSPSRLEYLVCLGLCRLGQNQPVAAEEAFRRAIAADGSQAIAWANLAVALDAQGRDREADEALERAESLGKGAADDPESFVDIAARRFSTGRTQEALALLESNLAQRPSARGHGRYAMALLTAGRLIEGWNQYEFRWLSDELRPYRSDSRRPQWAGQDLAGRTVLLRIEQGFGDAIQFLRYAPCLKALGATTLLVAFSDLARGFDGVDHVFDGATPTPQHDYYVNLMSLPRVFGSACDSIPAPVPYLRVEPDRRAKWKARLAGGDGPRVGLVWAGNPSHVRDRERSIALSALRPLLEIEGVRFVSLQVGPAAAQLSECAADFDLIDLGREVSGFADTAAVIGELDLVVCVDTAVAHLAGALGKPVWLLLPQPADWRWMEGREDTPWYPTMRLFRQRDRGDWAEVVERVAAALRDRISGEGQEGAAAARGAATTLLPVPVSRPGPPAGHRPGFSAVTEARAGILQYLPDEPEIGDSIGWYGEYLQGQVDVLARLLRPGMRILEIGAGVGGHSLPLAHAVGPSGHVLLAESRATYKRILRQNLAANGIGSVTILRDAPGGDGGAMVTLDALRMERLDCLKVNAGISALRVLAGGEATLWRLRPRLFVSMPGPAELATLASYAKDCGYRCWRIETPLYNPGNFNRRDDDIFGGRSALAMLGAPEEAATEVACGGGSELC